MRTKQERSQLQQIVGSPQWATVKQVALELCAKLNDDTKVKDSEWETLRATLTTEGMVRGIERLMQEVEKGANETEI